MESWVLDGEVDSGTQNQGMQNTETHTEIVKQVQLQYALEQNGKWLSKHHNEAKRICFFWDKHFQILVKKEADVYVRETNSHMELFLINIYLIKCHYIFLKNVS